MRKCHLRNYFLPLMIIINNNNQQVWIPVSVVTIELCAFHAVFPLFFTRFVCDIIITIPTLLMRRQRLSIQEVSPLQEVCLEEFSSHSGTLFLLSPHKCFMHRWQTACFSAFLRGSSMPRPYTPAEERSYTHFSEWLIQEKLVVKNQLDEKSIGLIIN